MISADGRVAGRGYQEITQHYPQPGWVEHDPEEIIERTLMAAREAIAASGVTPDVAAIPTIAAASAVARPSSRGWDGARHRTVAM